MLTRNQNVCCKQNRLIWRVKALSPQKGDWIGLCQTYLALRICFCSYTIQCQHSHSFQPYRTNPRHKRLLQNNGNTMERNQLKTQLVSQWMEQKQQMKPRSFRKRNVCLEKDAFSKRYHTYQEKAVHHGRKAVIWELAGRQCAGSSTLEMSVQCSEWFLRDMVEQTGAECTHLLRQSPLWLWEHVR